MTEWLTAQPDWLQALIRVLVFVVPILLVVPGLIWWERRLLSWMQDRIGPNRVGPFGLLQPIADGIKLFFKEDSTPISTSATGVSDRYGPHGIVPPSVNAGKRASAGARK